MLAENARLSISPQGMAFIKLFESFVPHPYDDLVVVGHRYPEWTGAKPVGTVTIGYGATAADIAIVPGMRMAEPEAARLLAASLERRYGPAVKARVTRPLAQHAYDALLSWTYNTGGPAGSEVWTRVNAGAAPDPVLMRYVRSKGRVLAGLERRRKGEIALYHGRVDEALAIARG